MTKITINLEHEIATTVCAGGAPVLLPCQEGNNSTNEQVGSSHQKKHDFTVAYLNKSQFVFEENVKTFIQKFGYEKCGLLTLTFADCPDWKESSRRFNSISTHVLRKIFIAYMGVVELQKRGAPHFHLIVACPRNIRQGFDFQKFKAKKKGYCKNQYLKSYWNKLLSALEKYSFGKIHQLTPLEKSKEAVSKYLTKYLNKSQYMRERIPKGARFTRYSKGWRSHKMGFTFNNEKTRQYRKNLIGVALTLGITRYEGLRKKYGKSWAYIMNEIIINYKCPTKSESIDFRKPFRSTNHTFSTTKEQRTPTDDQEKRNAPH